MGEGGLIVVSTTVFRVKTKGWLKKESGGGGRGGGMGGGVIKHQGACSLLYGSFLTLFPASFDGRHSQSNASDTTLLTIKFMHLDTVEPLG